MALVNDSLTYQNMQDRIADELMKSSLTAQIAKAIQSAIQHYERDRFYFNELVDSTFNTVASNEYYGTADGLPADIVEFDSLRITVSGRKVPLTMRTFAWMDEVSTLTTSSGQPLDWTYYQQKVRLYPIPDGVYTMTPSGVYRLAQLTSGGQSNAWMTSAEPLIRERAKADLEINIIKLPERRQERMALGMQGLRFLSTMEQAEYVALRHETTKRIQTGTIRPTQF